MGRWRCARDVAVNPIEFAEGDSGTFAVAGTVDDFAVGGARPPYLSCGMIIEEGVEVDLLRRLAHAMARTAAEPAVTIVAGDTKVAGRGACNTSFIKTSGIGLISDLDVDDA
jgi:hydrogenase expression/formation protein HypE